MRNRSALPVPVSERLVLARRDGSSHNGLMRLGAIILAGGASRRMGADKARLDWDGRSALERVADVASKVGAEHLVAAGAGLGGLDFPSVADESPGGGPVAGLAVGAAALAASGCDRALVLAVDAPTLRPDDLQPLLLTGKPGAAFAHLHLPMLVWLEALPAEAGAGWSMARLITEMRLTLIEPPAEALRRLRGANTPAERAELLDELAARKPGAG